jgi:V8-like Glu-specific endopeptidase
MDILDYLQGFAMTESRVVNKTNILKEKHVVEAKKNEWKRSLTVFLSGVSSRVKRKIKGFSRKR